MELSCAGWRMTRTLAEVAESSLKDTKDSILYKPRLQSILGDKWMVTIL